MDIRSGTTPASRLRLGVVGAGYWGANLVRVCNELGVLDTVCDASEATMATVAQQYPDVNMEFDVASMLRRDIDAVVLAAPAPLHAELAIECLEAGKHVFVEKPLATSVDDADAVVRAARQTGKTVFVGHVLLYHPAIQRMIELIREGAIGDVRHVRSRRLSWGKLRPQENVWWSFAPHDVALILEIFEEAPMKVSGSLSSFVRPNIADFANADLRFSRGRSAHIECSWLDPDKTARLDVFGSEGVLTLIDSRAGATLTLTPCGTRDDERGQPQLWREDPRNVSFAQAEPLKAEMLAFLRAVEEGSTPITDVHEGHRVVTVLAMLGNTTSHHPSLEAVS